MSTLSRFPVPSLPRIRDCLNDVDTSDARIHCPYCGCSHLFLVRREVFVVDNLERYRLVHDRFNPRKPHVGIDRDMRYGFGQNTTIHHYLCADEVAKCPAFSIRIGSLDGLCVRRSAPDIEQNIDLIRQAHMGAERREALCG